MLTCASQLKPARRDDGQSISALELCAAAGGEQRRNGATALREGWSVGAGGRPGWVGGRPGWVGGRGSPSCPPPPVKSLSGQDAVLWGSLLSSSDQGEAKR